MVSLAFGLCCLGQRATHKLPFKVRSDFGVAQATRPAAAGFCVALSLHQAGPGGGGGGGAGRTPPLGE